MTVVIPREYEIKPDVCPPGILIAARSYLIDRFVPDREIIMLPEKPVEGGHDQPTKSAQGSFDMPVPLPSSLLKLRSVEICSIAFWQPSSGCAHRRFQRDSIISQNRTHVGG